ncbi:hypothetical protein MINTM001_17160 [Mycobacterium paraintracellulare]|nr:hypothetical protein MINTM001_17160 [Mycobacterium paraintracellulare]
MVVSRGDAETLRSLVQNINVTSLVLGTILPLGSTALTWWLLLSLLVKITRPKPQRKPNWVLSLIMLTVFVVFVDFFAMPLLYGVINLAIFVAFLVCIVVLGLLVRVLSRTGAGPAGQPRLQKIMGRTQMANQFLARFWALVLFLGPLLIWLGFMGVWLPQERLKIGPAKVEPAYVISIDDRWTKYMDGAHKVHIVPTKDVIGRETVSKPGTWRKTLLDLWHEWWDNDNKARPGAPGTTTAVPTPPASPPPIAPAPATSLPSPSAPLPSAPPSLTQPAPSPTTAR